MKIPSKLKKIPKKDLPAKPSPEYASGSIVGRTLYVIKRIHRKDLN